MALRADEPGVGARRPPATILLAAMLAGGAAAIMWAGRGTTFVGDEWGWIFGALHPSVNSVLTPDNGHLMALTKLVYYVLPRVVGLGPYWVYRLLGLALHLGVAVLVFRYARPRVGERGALVSAALVVLLGTGADAFLSAINVAILTAGLTGVGALLALDRQTLRGDLAAGLLLLIGLLSFTSAVAFSAGAAAEVLLRRRRALPVVLIPAALYVGWRLHWAGGLLTRTGVAGGAHGGLAAVIGHGLQAASGAGAGLAGVQLMSPTLRAHLPWLGTAAEVLVVVALAVVVAVMARRGREARPPLGTPRVARLVNLGVTLWVLWVLLALGRGAHEDMVSSRYVYMGAVPLALLCVEALADHALERGRPRWAPALAAILVLVALGLNLAWMAVWGNHLRDEATVARAQLAALEIAGRRAPSDLAPPSAFVLAPVRAGLYLQARQRFGGSPAYSRAQLARAPVPARAAASSLLAQALGAPRARAPSSARVR